MRGRFAYLPGLTRLRAIAFLMVFSYHARPELSPSGFIGVDVFFTLSGYLVTGSLIGMLESGNRNSTLEFLRNRLARVQPAAIATVLIIFVLWAIDSGPVRFGALSSSALVSALQVKNFQLQSDAQDYFSSTFPDPFLHFWTLSIEVQFYAILAIFFPLAFRRLSPSTLQRAVTLFLITLLAWAIYMRQLEPTLNYVDLTGRLWQFWLGVAICLWLRGRESSLNRASLWAHQPVGIASLGALLALSLVPSNPESLWFFSFLASVFAGLSIVQEAQRTPTDGTSQLRTLFRPLEKIGTVSFSAYLIHYPVIMFAQSLNWESQNSTTLFALVATLVLAQISHWLFETKASRFLTTKHVQKSLVSLGAATLVLILFITQSSWLTNVGISQNENASVPISLEIKAPSSSYAAAIRDKPERRMSGQSSSELVVDKSDGLAPIGQTRTAILIVGDSHALHWEPAISEAYPDSDIYVVTKGSCSLNEAPRAARTEIRSSCQIWNKEVRRFIQETKIFDLVFIAANPKNLYRNEEKEPSFDVSVVGFEGSLQLLLAETNAKIVVIRDLPILREDLVECLDGVYDFESLVFDPCPTPVDNNPSDALWFAAAGFDENPRILRLDLTEELCEITRGCRSITREGIFIYRDQHHLTKTFSLSVSDNFSGLLG